MAGRPARKTSRINSRHALLPGGETSMAKKAQSRDLNPERTGWHECPAVVSGTRSHCWACPFPSKAPRASFLSGWWSSSAPWPVSVLRASLSISGLCVALMPFYLLGGSAHGESFQSSQVCTTRGEGASGAPSLRPASIWMDKTFPRLSCLHWGEE